MQISPDNKLVGMPKKDGSLDTDPHGKGRVVSYKRELMARARALGGDALRALNEVMQDDRAPAAARVSAAVAILDRGYGKPTTNVAGLGDPENPITHVHRIELVAGGEGDTIEGSASVEGAEELDDEEMGIVTPMDGTGDDNSED